MRKIPFAGVELTSQRVRGLRGTSELPGRPVLYKYLISTSTYLVGPRPNASSLLQHVFGRVTFDDPHYSVLSVEMTNDRESGPSKVTQPKTCCNKLDAFGRGPRAQPSTY